jgi:hypothetical protein
VAEPCKSTDSIGGWNVETLRQHLTQLLDERRVQMVGLLEERDRRLEERFKAQEQAVKMTAANLETQRVVANEFRATIADNNKLFMTESAFYEAHKALLTQVDNKTRFADQRMTNMDAERNALKDRLIVIESRVGFVSTSMIMAGLALLMALGEAVIMIWHVKG